MMTSAPESATTTTVRSLLPGDALLIVDVQNDFLPGGALAVPQGDQIVPVLNRYLEKFASRSLKVFASRDWHPANHCSFKEQGGPWPPHCVQNTVGAEFSPELNLPANAVVVSKATSPHEEAYSDFSDTAFEQVLHDFRVRRLFIGGLATEYCVLATVRDALARSFGVVLLTDAIRSLDVHPGDGARAIQEMVRLGAATLSLDALE